MTSRTGRRVLLYGIGILVLAVLGFFGFIYEAEPGIGQLVASAEVCANIGSVEDGIQWAERGLKVDPDHCYLHVILARCYERKEEYDRAAEYYERAVELTSEDEPERWLLVLHRARVLARGGHGPEACELARSVTEARPELLTAWYVLGRFHLEAKEYDQAEEAFLTASGRAPGEFEPYALLGEVASARGDDEAARRLLEKASRLVEEPSREAQSELQKLPQVPDTQVQRSELGLILTKHAAIEIEIARLHAKQGNMDAARARLDRAARLHPAAVRKALHSEPHLAPFLESAVPGEAAADGDEEKGQKVLKPSEADGR